MLRSSTRYLEGAKPSSSHHRSPEGERRGKRKRCSAIFLSRTAIVTPTNNGTVSKAALEKHLREVVECILIKGFADQNGMEWIGRAKLWCQTNTAGEGEGWGGGGGGRCKVRRGYKTALVRF